MEKNKEIEIAARALAKEVSEILNNLTDAAIVTEYNLNHYTNLEALSVLAKFVVSKDCTVRIYLEKSTKKEAV